MSAALVLQRMLEDAVRARVTDVHVCPQAGRFVIQFRLDGRLVAYLRQEGDGQTLVRRIKALARMDVAETRIPQDGAFVWVSEATNCNVRVATLPTVHGETLVMRLFATWREPIDFRSLGMTEEQAARLNSLLLGRPGMILVSGPTRSGKTTTLYAMMLQLARCGRKVVSIEDPVEVAFEEVYQVEVRERMGMTFATGVRAVLRQDPDAIMIGEIRDEETARMAVRAALTGHMVVSTTHALTERGAVSRLRELGVPAALLLETLCAIVVQSSSTSSGRAEAGFHIAEPTPAWFATSTDDAAEQTGADRWGLDMARIRAAGTR